MSDGTPTTRRKPSGKVEDVFKNVVDTAVETVNPDLPDWAVGFDDEDYPDAVSVGVDETIVFTILSSNFIPLLNPNTGLMEDVEASQLLLMAGTTATEKEKVGNEYVSTGEVIPIGEIRTLWINSKLLRDLWDKWDAQNDDQGAAKFLGHVEGKRKGSRPYQKWVGKFNKPLPRKQSAAR